jgi:hypothetical protein
MGPDVIAKHNREWDLMLFDKTQPEMRSDDTTETQPRMNIGAAA